MSLRFRTALVTGGSRGFGFAVTRALAQEGVRVWATARDLARVPRIEGVSPLRYDLAEPGGARALLYSANAESGGIDLLVCNAGFGVFGGFETVAWPEWRAQVDQLLGSTMELAHQWLDGGARAGRDPAPALVAVSSLAAEFPIPGLGAYSAAKAGLSAWTLALAAEWTGRGVQIVDLRLGDLRTGFNDAVRKPDSANASDARLARIWARLEHTLAAAPPPEVAARQLLDALRANRSGTVRAGSFAQATLAPLGSRLLPLRLQQRLAARYFGVASGGG